MRDRSGVAFVMVALLVVAAGTAGAQQILFVGNDPDPTSGADNRVFRFLGDRYGAGGVTYMDADDAVSGSEAGFDLLVISSTPGSGSIRGKWDATTVGIVNWEEAVSDDGGGEFMMADSITKNTSNPVRYDIVNTAHPIAAGLTAGVTDFTIGNAETFYGNTLGAGVQSIGTWDTDANRKAILAADVGDILRGGGTSPNRRVMFGMTDNTFDQLSAAGLKLFGQACDWAGNLTPLAAKVPSLVWYSPLDGSADAAVGGVNGVLQGNTGGTADRDGNPNSALIFDGSGDNVVIDKTTLPSDFSEGSITAWARVDATPGETGVVAVGGSGGGSDQYFNIMLGGGGDNYRTDVDRGGSGNDGRVDAQDPNVVDGEWHHLAMTFITGGGNDSLRLYMDGIEIANDNLTSATAVAPTNDWVIGADRLTSRYFNGAIDDVAIWSTALSNADILALATGAETPLSLIRQDVIPEPATCVLLAAGLVGCALRRRKRAA